MTKINGVARLINYRRGVRRISFYFFAFLLMSHPVFAQIQFQKDSLDARLQQWLPEVNERTPGYVIGILTKDGTVYSRASGSANIELGVSLSEKNIFNIGSVSKQFAGYSILQLAEEGKLNVHDRVHKYLPEYPVFQNNDITVFHLLHHTSGLREMFELLEVSDGQVAGITTEQVKYILQKQKTLNFPPGEYYEYNNTGFFVLALLVEKVSGIAYPEYLQQKIFKPLSMNTATVLENDSRLVPNRTEAYIKSSTSNFLRSNPTDNFYGPGGIYCSLSDLLKWGANFITKKEGGISLYQKFTSKGMYRKGQPINYANGLFIDQYKGIKIIEHDGSRLGYTSQFLYLPEKEMVIVILANSRSFPVRSIYRKLMDYLFKDQFPAEPVLQSAKAVIPPIINLDKKTLSKYTSVYWNSISDLTRKVYLKNDTLFYQRTTTNESAMLPVDESTFLLKVGGVVTNNKVRFSKKPKSSIWQFDFMPERGDTTFFVSVDTAKNRLLDLQPYTGMFYSEELDTKFEIIKKNEHLVLIIKGWQPIKLEQGFMDYFFNIDFGGSIYFGRDNRKTINSFVYTSARTKYLRFSKIKLAKQL